MGTLPERKGQKFMMMEMPKAKGERFFFFRVRLIGHDEWWVCKSDGWVVRASPPLLSWCGREDDGGKKPSWACNSGSNCIGRGHANVITRGADGPLAQRRSDDGGTGSAPSSAFSTTNLARAIRIFQSCLSL